MRFTSATKDILQSQFLLVTCLLNLWTVCHRHCGRQLNGCESNLCFINARWRMDGLVGITHRNSIVTIIKHNLHKCRENLMSCPLLPEQWQYIYETCPPKCLWRKPSETKKMHRFAQKQESGRQNKLVYSHEAMPVYPQLASYGIDHSEQTGLLYKKFAKFISRKEPDMLLRYNKNHLGALQHSST